MSQCPRCDRAMNADRHACRECAAEVAKALVGAADLVASLNGKRARRGSPSFNASSRSAVIPLPYDARVTPVEHAVRNAVGGWARIVTEEHPAHPDAPAGLGETCRWIAGYCPWLAKHESAVEAFDELTDACARLDALFEVPPTLISLGQCGADDDEGGTCPAIVEAEPDATQATCRRCGAAVDAQERRKDLVISAGDYLVTIREATRLLKMSGASVDAKMLRAVVRVVGVRVEGSMPTPGGGPVADAYRLGALRDAVEVLSRDDDTRKAVNRLRRGA